MTKLKKRANINILLRILILAGIVITFIFLKHFKTPFIWVFFSWFIILLLNSIFSVRTSTRLAFFYVSLVPLIFGIFETYFSFNKNRAISQNFTRGAIARNHEILGYAPVRNFKAKHKKYFKKELIFDVVYTIDANGLRISPHCNSEKLLGSILFFGGSFTFGTGLNDTETLPYQTGIKTHGMYCIYNFGFRGYGPHQMLSSLEHGLVEKITKYKPKYVIYQALIGHIGRSAGLAFWDEYGPRYILDKNGDLKYAGHFKPGFISLFRKSAIFRKFFVKQLAKMDFGEGKIDLFVEIIASSKKTVERLFPGCEFHLILWNKKHNNYPQLLLKLRKKAINVHPVSKIFRKSTRSFQGFELKISKHDPHPTALTNEIISEYLINEIIKE